METICWNKEELEDLKLMVPRLDKDATNPKVVRDIVDRIIPRDEDGKAYASLRLKDNGQAAAFSPNYNGITVSLENYKENAEGFAEVICKNGRINNSARLVSYLELFSLVHEVKHVRQKLIAKGIEQTPYQGVNIAYKEIFDVITKKDFIIPRPITQIRKAISEVIYYTHAYDFVLERNADIEALRDVIWISESLGDEEEKKGLELFMCLSESVGYLNNGNGSIQETFKKMHMMDKYKRLPFDCEISLDERIRYGLPISDDVQISLIKQLKQPLNY